MKLALQLNDCTVRENSVVHLKLSAKYKDANGEHTTVQHIEKFNVWRDMDLLPETIVKDVVNKEVGESDVHHFTAGEFYPAWESGLVKTLPLKDFNGRLNSGELVKPHVGRYYPKGWFTGVDGIYSENMFPARVVDIVEESITVDYNHPLSRYDVELQIEIIDIFPPADEHGGRCSDAIQTLLTNGPGMQLPEPGRHTDIFIDSLFNRVDEEDDSIFYQQPRLVHHLDANARSTISNLYGQLIKPGSDVLDLMSSWESHLPDSLSKINVSGLGLNEEELRSNPVLSDYLVYDLNKESQLPYSDETFDAAICTASVEYLSNPVHIFKEIKRILKPGGVCVVTFSNRWFPSKAISVWSEMHDFERMGLVMEYFTCSEWEEGINTYSSRGLDRPLDDPHYKQLQFSDPVFAVWSYK